MNQDQKDKATALAWKISAERGCSFDEAWNIVQERIIAIGLTRFMRKLGCEPVKDAE